ncbi:hypothetical protein Taro_049948 [Colocasia esculenta]|uniref:Protein kinase domain-containing protein n=1 Tax=Colocasia esculenta TaxID=4460 RepID=A0A843XC56_COLES|nr:hypothetical protein [Colocasia esculenta]
MCSPSWKVRHHPGGVARLTGLGSLPETGAMMGVVDGKSMALQYTSVPPALITLSRCPVSSPTISSECAQLLFLACCLFFSLHFLVCFPEEAVLSAMEKRTEICTAWVLCLVFTLSGNHGSAGTHPSPSPEIPSAFPPSRQDVPSPTCCDDSPTVDAPSSLPISKGPAPHITFDFSPSSEALPPDVKGMTRSLHPSPSATHVADNDTWPMARPPALDDQAPPHPARTADDISPSSSISPTPQTRQMPQGNIYGKSPSSDAPTALPMAPVLSSPLGLPVNAPPSDTVQTKEPQRKPCPAASPTSSLPPDVYGGGEGVPVAAPPPEMSNHLSPINRTDTRGLFPVLSPMPHGRKPYKYTPAPTLHPGRPSTNVVEVPAPSISHHIHKSREKYRSPAAAPTFSLPHAAWKRYGAPVAAPSEETHYHLSPINHIHITGPPVLSPIPHEDGKAHKYASAPSTSYHRHPSEKLVPVPAPAISNHEHEARENVRSPSSAPSYLFPPFYVQGPTASSSPLVHPGVPLKYGGRYHTPPPLLQSTGHTHSPTPSPSGSLTKKPRAPVPQPIRAFPPPPPNLDCLSLPCTEPYTNPPPGSPCICALPMKVKLRLGVALYTFFPLVSELAQEIADGVSMKQSQVRVMGANAATEQPEKTIVLIDLVPLGQKFDNVMAFLTYERFWHKQISIKASYFGDYDVLYILYPGLPPSPPLPPYDIMDGGPFGSNSNSRTIQPLGVDVRKKRKEKLSTTVIVVLVVSSVIAFILCAGAAWFLLLKLKHQGQTDLSISAPQLSMPPYIKASVIGTGPTLSGSGPGSTSGSLSSSIATYTGSAKTFSTGEMERATNKFDDSRIIGEGGFGRVYEGKLEDGMKVAVKVLKRDDQQGSREFLAEIEMLSRLHHRNLVRLIGICTDEHLRCLVYELIPNGSVESHLHGVHKEAGPLDWGARMKIALGSARALAYLHEDSSPRVIHRDFKSSNILLEYDFTPKVSDFGLARTALDGGNVHISTKVMGTFGYVAPEYALTGHLLVKSDVYSYGVVLLELLTGRKPVDMSQPPGQENLVAWAHPLISNEDLESFIDPTLGSDFPFDSVVRVAAIASMCVQPEVSHRPFMGEVVQALKLVCHESDEPGGSGSFSLEDLPPSDMDLKIGTGIVFEGDSRRALSSENFGASAMLTRETSGSFRRHSSSGPLKMSKSGQFWRRMRGFSGGSMSDNGLSLRFSSNMEGSETKSSGWS